MSDYDTVKELQKAVETELSDLIDFQSYEDILIREPNEEACFYFYDFVWYNAISDVMIDDYISLRVSPDGTINTIWLNRKNSKLTPAAAEALLNPENDTDIQEKIAQIYNTKQTQYQEYEVSSSLLTIYKGQPCLVYTMVVHFTTTDADSGEIFEDHRHSNIMVIGTEQIFR